MVAVGTRISPRPPHRSRRALLTHRAPPSDDPSLDHFVGAHEECLWQREIYCFSCPQIDHKLVFCWRLNGKVGRSFALQYAIDVGSSALIAIVESWSVRSEATI